MGRAKLLQCKRPQLVCKLVVEKEFFLNHRLQVQVESSAKKTLTFPETK